MLSNKSGVLQKASHHLGVAPKNLQMHLRGKARERGDMFSNAVFLVDSGMELRVILEGVPLITLLLCIFEPLANDRFQGLNENLRWKKKQTQWRQANEKLDK